MTLFHHRVQPLPIFLSFLVAFPVGSLPAAAQALPPQLNIVVLQGEGAINKPRQRVARDPVIRVEDEDKKPLAGVAVVFALPTEGASGEFTNGAKTLAVMTDSKGEAVAQGLRTNQVGGKLVIYVTASAQGRTAAATISQTTAGASAVSASSSSGGHGKLIAILILLGAAGAGGGAYAATRKSGSTTPSAPSPIGITPGTGTIAPPH